MKDGVSWARGAALAAARRRIAKDAMRAIVCVEPLVQVYELGAARLVVMREVDVWIFWVP